MELYILFNLFSASACTFMSRVVSYNNGLLPRPGSKGARWSIRSEVPVHEWAGMAGGKVSACACAWCACACLYVAVWCQCVSVCMFQGGVHALFFPRHCQHAACCVHVCVCMREKEMESAWQRGVHGGVTFHTGGLGGSRLGGTFTRASPSLLFPGSEQSDLGPPGLSK